MLNPDRSCCPSHFVLDQRALGELESDALRSVDEHVASCARCQARMAARRADEGRFVLDLTTLRALQSDGFLSSPADDPGLLTPSAPSAPSWSSRTVAANATPERSRPAAVVVAWARRARGALAGGALAGGALAAALVLAVVRSGGADGGLSPSDDIAAMASIRTKGGASSGLFVQDARGVRALDTTGAAAGAAGALVHPGDTLQVAVTSSSPVFVAVLSHDAQGQVSRYVVAADDALVAVAPGRNVPLPGATVLDDVLGNETVAVFLCERATVTANELTAIVVDGNAPPGCVVERHLVRKIGSR